MDNLIGFLFFVALADVAFSTPLTDPKTGVQKKLTTAETKCQEYIKLTSTDSKPKTPSDGVTRKELPHMARLGSDGDSKKLWFCGGTLISEYFILTGAYCVTTPSLKAKYIMLGSWHQDPSLDPSSQEFGISETHVYPGFGQHTFQHDIALVKLDRKVEFNEHIRPICLNTKDSSYKQVTVSGWGALKDGGNQSETLKIVSQRINSNDKCAELYNGDELMYNSTTMICAGPTDQDKDACQGDGGGPLQLPLTEAQTAYLQIGIVSFGQGCGNPEEPAAYTKISNYIPWIEKIVWP